MTGKRPRIFVVDDDESVGKSLRRLLASAGYNVEVFNSGAKFLDSVPMDSEGVLILDLRMPNMDGFELQRKLIELRSPLNLIFITAHANPGDRENAMANGACGFLQKPFNDESLFALIEECSAP